jgi:hypothetical protein
VRLDFEALAVIVARNDKEAEICSIAFDLFEGFSRVRRLMEPTKTLGRGSTNQRFNMPRIRAAFLVRPGARMKAGHLVVMIRREAKSVEAHASSPIQQTGVLESAHALMAACVMA